MNMRLAIAAAILVGVVLAGAALKQQEGGESRLVLATFPGIDGDLRLLLQGCQSVEVGSIAPPGADPHTYSLRPEDVKLIERAILIVSTGHAPFEEAVAEYAPEKTIIIPSIPGIRLERLPTGAVNLHAPIYDPDNYIVFARFVAQKLAAAIPECNATIQENLRGVLSQLNRTVASHRGVLEGERVVAASPLAQYAVGWLGAEIVVYLSSEHGAQVRPEDAQKAGEALRQGAIAVIIVDERGEPVGPASEYLLKAAQETGARIMRVEAPFTEKPLLTKIIQVAFEAALIAGGG